MKKKLLSVLLAATLTTSMLAGCGSNGDTQKDSQSERSEVEKESEAESSSEEPQGLEGDLNGDGELSELETLALNIPGGVPDLSGVTLNILTVPSDIPDNGYDTILPIFKQVEELTGVTLVWEECAMDSFDTVLQTRLLSDEPLDIFWNGNPTGAKLAQWTKEGIIYDIQQAYDVTPGIKKYMTELSPHYAAKYTYTDGGLYTVPCARYESYETMNAARNNLEETITYRADIAAELGWTEDPETIQDWYELLTAVKENYPDMIPYGSGEIFSFWYDDLGTFGAAWGIHSNTAQLDTFIAGEDGKVYHQGISDEMKAFITEMNKWYEEGLLSFTLGGDNRTSLPANGQVFAAFNSSWALQYYLTPEYKEANPDAQFMAAPLPTTEGYELTYMGRPTTDGSWYVVDNGDEQARAALQFIDFTFFSEYGRALGTLGVMGSDSWWFDESGELETTDEFVTAVNTGTLDPNTGLQGCGMWYKGPQACVALRDFDEKFAAYADATGWSAFEEDVQAVLYDQEEAVKKNTESITDPYPVQFLGEEEEEYNTIIGDINTYIKETLSKMIIGEVDLSEWDNFVETALNDYNLARATEIQQKYYDMK